MKWEWGPVVTHCAERIPLRLSPHHSSRASNPARGPFASGHPPPPDFPLPVKLEKLKNAHTRNYRSKKKVEINLK